MTDATQQAAWDENAAVWARHVVSGKDPNYDEILFPALLNALPSELDGKRILDVGCGEGRLARSLRDRGARVVAVDFSEALISEAQSARGGRKNIDYRVGAAEDLDRVVGGEREFDVVIANMSLHCMRDPHLVIHKMAHLVSPGGQLVFSVLHPCFPLRIYESGELLSMDNRFGNPEGLAWPEDSYFSRRTYERGITPDFPAKTQVHRRMVEEYIEAIGDAGLAVSRLLEPRPSRDLLEGRKDLLAYENYRRFPFFLVLSAVRVGGGGAESADNGVLKDVLEFRDKRDWAQFQTIKNNAISLCLESAELLDNFHWLDDEEAIRDYVEQNQDRLQDELADVYMNLLLLANDLDIDLASATRAKLAKLRTKNLYTESQAYSTPVTPADKNHDTSGPARFR